MTEMTILIMIEMNMMMKYTYSTDLITKLLGDIQVYAHTLAFYYY